MKGQGRTDIGKVRKKNQDAIFVCDEQVGGLENLYVVADGMGGHRAGEIASKFAVEAFCGYLKTTPLDKTPVEEYLAEGVRLANAKVYAESIVNVDWRGMGTTFSACTVTNGRLYFAHVGDSRIYEISSGAIKQISQDHSFVAEMLRLGKLTEDEARIHPNKNVLTRALGTEISVEADSGSCDIAEGARFLLCSDGLSNMVSDAEILEIMQKNLPDDKKADELVSMALKNGGKDNISLIIV